MIETDVAIVGAGPIGLELAIALKRAGINYVQFDKGSIAQTITWFPRLMTFFSSNDRIAIAGVPIQTNDQGKCSREQYLSYLRSLVLAFELEVKTHEPVVGIERAGDGFLVTTEPGRGTQRYRARRVVLATGDMHRPHRLGIEGEDLEHVSHYFKEAHEYCQRRVLIVGGKNSAAEAALRCYHAGADVTMSYRRGAFDEKSVKYWLLPELLGRIKRGEIACHYNTTPRRIARTTVTRETNVAGIYVAGTALGGSQQSYRLFIENCHIHVEQILAALQGQAPPPLPDAQEMPES